jgi:hypothetical protein
MASAKLQRRQGRNDVLIIRYPFFSGESVIKNGTAAAADQLRAHEGATEVNCVLGMPLGAEMT